MIRWIVYAVAQVPDRRFLGVLALSGLCALAAFYGVWRLLDWQVARIDVTGWPGWLANAWSFADGWIVGVVTAGLSFFLFTAVATAIMSLFLDTIVDAVESRHYRGWKATRNLGLANNLRLGLASAARLLGWNLLLLPVYIALTFTVVGPFLLFLAVNSWLLGRDYLDMVLLRHRSREQARAMTRANTATALVIGGITSALLLVPFLGIIGPLVGAAIATHAAHSLMAHAAVPDHSART